ncbi:MAG: hypothetical protein V3S39_08440 [Thermodesulfobacteriota bacterium]
MFATNKAIKEKPDTLPRVVKAALDSGSFITKNRQYTRRKLKELFKYSDKGVELAQDSLQYTGTGRINPKGVQAVLDFMSAHGIIPKEKLPPTEKIFTNQLFD